jgi:lysozyme
MKHKKKRFPVLMLLLIIGICLCYNGYYWPNYWFALAFPVHGIDVSHHQEKIDWNRVAKSNQVKFAFIKATEGQDFRDRRFQKNWGEASRNGIKKGAYHYFTITSPGIAQARHFIATVPRESGCLPPMVDIEESGLTQEKFQRELTDFLTTVESHYGQKPILYVVYSLYEQYIKGDFLQYPIWIRDVVKPPRLSDNRKWLIWQYGHRGRIPGISTFVDLNVWNGDLTKL